MNVARFLSARQEDLEEFLPHLFTGPNEPPLFGQRALHRRPSSTNKKPIDLEDVSKELRKSKQELLRLRRSLLPTAKKKPDRDPDEREVTKTKIAQLRKKIAKLRFLPLLYRRRMHALRRRRLLSVRLRKLRRRRALRVSKASITTIDNDASSTTRWLPCHSYMAPRFHTRHDADSHFLVPTHAFVSKRHRFLYRRIAQEGSDSRGGGATVHDQTYLGSVTMQYVWTKRNNDRDSEAFEEALGAVEKVLQSANIFAKQKTSAGLGFKTHTCVASPSSSASAVLVVDGKLQEHGLFATTTVPSALLPVNSRQHHPSSCRIMCASDIDVCIVPVHSHTSEPTTTMTIVAVLSMPYVMAPAVTARITRTAMSSGLLLATFKSAPKAAACLNTKKRFRDRNRHFFITENDKAKSPLRMVYMCSSDAGAERDPACSVLEVRGVAPHDIAVPIAKAQQHATAMICDGEKKKSGKQQTPNEKRMRDEPAQGNKQSSATASAATPTPAAATKKQSKDTKAACAAAVSLVTLAFPASTRSYGIVLSVAVRRTAPTRTEHEASSYTSNFHHIFPLLYVCHRALFRILSLRHGAVALGIQDAESVNQQTATYSPFLVVYRKQCTSHQQRNAESTVASYMSCRQRVVPASFGSDSTTTRAPVIRLTKALRRQCGLSGGAAAAVVPVSLIAYGSGGRRATALGSSLRAVDEVIPTQCEGATTRKAARQVGVVTDWFYSLALGRNCGFALVSAAAADRLHLPHFPNSVEHVRTMLSGQNEKDDTAAPMGTVLCVGRRRRTILSVSLWKARTQLWN